MDLVIPLRDVPSMYDDEELRYALRSIDKHFDAGDVWCVGSPREWLTVNWIDKRDDQRYRFENARQKVAEACKCPAISDPFVLWNDDFFLLKDTSTDLPDYYDGTIQDRIASAGGDYRALMERTLPYSDGRNYSVHVPMVIHKELFLKTQREGMLFRNVYGSASPNKKAEIKDPKMYRKEHHQNFMQFIKGKWVFSTSEFSFKWIADRMDRMYPHKSRWE